MTQEFSAFVEKLDERSVSAHELANLTLRGYRSSERILDHTARLRILGINAFVKTDSGDDNAHNTFAPVTSELLRLMQRQSEGAHELGRRCTELVGLLVEYVKNVRRYRLFCIAVVNAIVSWEGLESQGDVSDGMNGFISGRIPPSLINPALSLFIGRQISVGKSYVEVLSVGYTRILATQDLLLRFPAELVQIAQVSGYAVQIALIEGARMDGRDDVSSAFNEIQMVLEQNLEEVNIAQQTFERFAEAVGSLSWGEEHEKGNSDL